MCRYNVPEYFFISKESGTALNAFLIHMVASNVYLAGFGLLRPSSTVCQCRVVVEWCVLNPLLG